MKYFVGLLVLLGLGCKQADNQNMAGKKRDSTMVLLSNKTECLDWESIKLNGTIPMLSGFKQTVKELGKPDSIVPQKNRSIRTSFFNNQKWNYCYFRGLEFEQSNDRLAFRSVDFRINTALFLKSDKISLDYATTLADFKKVFPKAGSNELHHTAMDEYIAVDINAAKDGKDDQWMLTFSANGNNLLKIEYWIAD